MNSENKEYYRDVFANYPDVVNVEQMSEMLGICTRTAYQLLKSGAVKHIKIGRFYKVPKWNIIIYLLKSN